MKRKIFIGEQIISILKEHEAGARAVELGTALWRGREHDLPLEAQFGGTEVSHVKRLKTLEAENAKLKRLPECCRFPGSGVHR
jgi:putative transposase